MEEPKRKFRRVYLVCQRYYAYYGSDHLIDPISVLGAFLKKSEAQKRIAEYVAEGMGKNLQIQIHWLQI